MHELEIEYVSKFGPIYGTYLFLKPILHVADPESIKKISVTDFKYFPQRFEDGTEEHPVTKLFLTVVNGQEWKRQRELVTPSFSPLKIKNMVPLMMDCVMSMDQSIRTSIKNVPTIVDTRKLYAKFSLDVIARCCFGTKLDCQSSDTNPFFKFGFKLFVVTWIGMIKFILFPIWFKKLIQFTTTDAEGLIFFSNLIKELIYRRRDKECPERVEDFFQTLIDATNKGQQLKAKTDGANNGNDGTDGNLVLSDYGTKPVDDIDGDDDKKSSNVESGSKKSDNFKPFTDLDLISNSVAFLGVGNETTSVTMAFASYCLAMNPDIQERLFEEVSSVICSIDGDNQQMKVDVKKINYETIEKIEYLDNFVSEVLRLHTPVPRIPRVAWKDYVLKYGPDDGKSVSIPKGTLVYQLFQAMNQNDNYWRDPLIFDPERFSKANRTQIVPYSYVPFGTGPRYCIGMRFAMIEIKLALALQVVQFKLSKCQETEKCMKYVTNMFLLQTKDMKIVFEPRKLVN